MKKTIGLLIILLIIGGLIYATKKHQPKPPPPQMKEIWAKDGIPVEVGSVILGDIEDTASITGNINAQDKLSLSAKIPGRVLAVNAREGDNVSAGQIIIVLEQDDARNQLRQAEAAYQTAVAGLSTTKTNAAVTKTQMDSTLEQAKSNLETVKEQLKISQNPARSQERLIAENSVKQAMANMDNAESEYKRSERLFKQGAISESSYELARTQFTVAQANYNTAKQQLSLIDEGGRTEVVSSARNQVKIAEQALRQAKANSSVNLMRQEEIKQATAGVQNAKAVLAMAKQNLDNTYVKSTIAGTLSRRMVEPGQIVSPGISLGEVVNLGSIFFQGDVSEKVVAKVKKGQRVDVVIDAVEGRVFNAVVDKVYPSAPTSSRNFPVRIKILNKSSILKDGMFARGNIIIGVVKNALLIPKDAVDDRRGIKVVFTAVKDPKNPQFEISNRHNVEIIRMNRDFVQIIPNGEIKPGDVVITSGRQNLEDESKILRK